MRPRRTSSETLSRATSLRNDATQTERRLWAFIRNQKIQGVRFRRQHAIGPFIADFCSPKLKLIIEVDGSQHLDRVDYDAARTEYLQSRGYTVLRFWNSDVMKDIEGVIRVIELEIARKREI